MDQPQDETRIIAALYAQYPESGDNEDSNPDQVQRMGAFCEETGLTPGEAYVDRDGSREEFDRMMADGTAENPPFRRIVVCDLSRFARYAEELTECTESLEANGISVMSVAQGSYSPAQLATIMPMVVNELHRKKSSDRIREGFRHEASSGHFVSSKAPYGYRKVEAHDGVGRHYTLEPDPETAPTVRRIYDLALNGSSDPNTALDLNNDGIPAPNGGPWKPGQVGNVRQNKVNCGTYVYGKKDTDNQIRAENAFPAIVSRAEFDLAQQVQERYRAPRPRSRPRTT